MPADRGTPTFYVSKAAPPLLFRLLAQIDVGHEPFRSLSWSEEVPHRSVVSQRQMALTMVIQRYAGSSPANRDQSGNQRDEQQAHHSLEVQTAQQQQKNRRTGQQNIISPDSQLMNHQSNVRPIEDLGLSTEDEDEDEEDFIRGIAKPPGEAGRPGRGGYNLESALNWAHEDFEKVKAGGSRFNE